MKCTEYILCDKCNCATFYPAPVEHEGRWFSYCEACFSVHAHALLSAHMNRTLNKLVHQDA